MLVRDEWRRDPVKLKDILCLVALGCCALKIADLQAHNAVRCELVDRLFSACYQCKISHYDPIKACQNTFWLTKSTVDLVDYNLMIFSRLKLDKNENISNV